MSNNAISASVTRNVSALTIALWFAAALLEGIDLQSAGIAAPGIAGEFMLDKAQLGWVLSASTFGLVIGAAVGGRLADWRGRKFVLVLCVTLYGLFSIATAQSWSFATLVLARFLTGVGMGGAMPNLVAMVSESVPPRLRSTMMGLMYCGMPVGSAVAAGIGWLLIDEYGWRVVFYIGGIGPVLIAPLLAWGLPESRDFAQRKAQVARVAPQAIGKALFGDGRLIPTLGLWLSFFFVLFALYELLSWLPTLLIAKGYDRATAASFLILFNLGAMCGMILSCYLLDHSKRASAAIIAMYLAVMISLGLLAYGTGDVVVALGVTGAGMFTAAVQLVVYGLAPNYYEPLIRGTGMGWLVAIGRCGSVAGPLSAGLLLAAGIGASDVLVIAIPGLILAMIAVLIVLARTQRSLA